jgi:hypothetical protein
MKELPRNQAPQIHQDGCYRRGEAQCPDPAIRQTSAHERSASARSVPASWRENTIGRRSGPLPKPPRCRWRQTPRTTPWRISHQRNPAQGRRPLRVTPTASPTPAGGERPSNMSLMAAPAVGYGFAGSDALEWVAPAQARKPAVVTICCNPLAPRFDSQRRKKRICYQVAPNASHSAEIHEDLPVPLSWGDVSRSHARYLSWCGASSRCA